MAIGKIAQKMGVLTTYLGVLTTKVGGFDHQSYQNRRFGPAYYQPAVPHIKVAQKRVLLGGKRTRKGSYFE
jgi:hypothetical protein